MRKELYLLVGFVGGCLAGYFATKNYFEKAIKEEDRARREEEKQKEKEKKKEEEKTLDEMSKEAEKARDEYLGELDEEEAKKEWPGKEYNSMEGPVVIKPEEADRLAGYDVEYLTWYEQEGVLVRNEVDTSSGEEEVITDIARTIGADSLERFGEFEEDSVYVRDDSTATIYVIEREYSKYDGYEY